MINIQLIARLITEDPQLFNEDLAGQSLVNPTLAAPSTTQISPTDADASAKEVTDVDPKATINQQKLEQERQQKQDQLQQQKLLKPQMQKLDKATNTLTTGLQASQQANAETQQRDLDLSQSVDDLKKALTSTTMGMSAFSR